MLGGSITSVKNVKPAVEMLVYSLDYLTKRNDLNSVPAIISGLFSSYKYEDYKDNKLLSKYKIKKSTKDENFFTYRIDNRPCTVILTSIETQNTSFIENTFLKMQAMYNAICAAIKNYHDKTAEELIKEVLKTADLNLTIFLRNNDPKYCNYNDKGSATIAKLIILLELESQVHAFQILEQHYQKNFYVLVNFSNALLGTKRFDETIELLESKLANIDNEAPANESIGACYYNLGLAYHNKADYQSAKKYHLSALKHLPNDQDTIVELIKICLASNEIEIAENYIKSLQSEDIKNLFEMSFDVGTLSTTKLKSVTSKPIPETLTSLVLSLEYIAKFNEGKFSKSDKAKVLNKLINSYNNNTLWLSAAIYTEQFDIAKNIAQKIPKKELFQNKYLW
ncbi:tetratricopeptide repeat protein [Rickettsia hoogstraalii]|uniref:tetratricopeptide repeat protein n=2 Tax=Rickettsia hoogstraalii TaxID=467174 RepID=UPI00058CB5F8|nr:tetratricopeptide repeat protein [Rickettsia hoogstraalii]